MSTALPTGTFDSWAVTSLRDSLLEELAIDRVSNALKMFFYAITLSGWEELQKPVLQWPESVFSSARTRSASSSA